MSSKAKRKSTLIRHRESYGWLFCAPWLIGAAAFFVYPLIYSIRLSFSKIVDLASRELAFAGLANYKDAFSKDIAFMGHFVESFKDTIINMPLIVVFSLVIAIMLNTNIKGRATFRAIYFLPVMLGTGFVMQQLLSSGINEDIAKIAYKLFLSDEVVKFLPTSVTEAILNFLNRMTLILWKSGVQIVIFLAALQSVPTSLYEAARVDSASEWECFWFITLPMVTPMILLNSVYTLVASFSDTSNPILIYIQDMAFRMGFWEFSSAVSWVYFGFVLLVLGVVFLILGPASKRATS